MESFRNQPWLGFEVVGVYHDPKPGGVSNDWAGNLQQLVEDAKAGKIHNVYIAMQMCDGARVKKTGPSTGGHHLFGAADPRCLYLQHSPFRLEEMNGVPVVPLYDTPLSGVNRLLKRAEDIVLATLILLLISPVLCCIALAVKLSSPGTGYFPPDSLWHGWQADQSVEVPFDESDGERQSGDPGDAERSARHQSGELSAPHLAG